MILQYKSEDWFVRVLYQHKATDGHGHLTIVLLIEKCKEALKSLSCTIDWRLGLDPSHLLISIVLTLRCT